MSATQPETLPVNVKNITDKRHIIFRLDKIQREVLDQPERFSELDEDPSLNHVRKEIEALKVALLRVAKAEASFEYKAVRQASDLLKLWDGEQELRDLLLLDNHRQESFEHKFETSETYLDWRHLIENMRDERQSMFEKYRGYFNSQDQEVDRRKEQNELALKDSVPQMEAWRKISEPLLEIQQEVNFYLQLANKYMVGGIGALVGITLLGHISGIWGGWLWGVIIGYNVFQSMVNRYAYIEGKGMLDLFNALKERYELKQIRRYFQFEQIEIIPEPKKSEPSEEELKKAEEKKKPEYLRPGQKKPPKKAEAKKIEPPKPKKKFNYENPLRYDASRGESLSALLQKDIVEAQKAFLVLERKREDYKGYLGYLENRRSWYRDQIRKTLEIEKISYKPKVEPKKKKILSSEHLELNADEQIVDNVPLAPEENGFAQIPVLPEQPKVTRKTSRRTMKVRPADLGQKKPESDNPLSPERVS